MEQFLTSPVILVLGAVLALAGLIVAVRLLPLSQPDPSTKVPLRGRLYQVVLILAIAGSGIALLLLGVAWARLFGTPPKMHVWGLTVLGVLQMAIGIVLFVVGRPDEGTLPAASKLFRRWGLPAFVLVAGLAWILLGLAAAVSPDAPDTAQGSQPVITRQRINKDDGRQTLIGIVQDGELWVLTPATSAGLSARLTGIAMQESVSPESREIDLSDYEGSAILVHGHDGGGWIYEAEVIDRGGPLLTEIAEQAFR